MTDSMLNETVLNESDCEDETEIELVVQGKTITVNEKLLIENSRYFKKIFSEFNSNDETIVLKHGKEFFIT